MPTTKWKKKQKATKKKKKKKKSETESQKTEPGTNENFHKQFAEPIQSGRNFADFCFCSSLWQIQI